jgi:hypothetical protein
MGIERENELAKGGEIRKQVTGHVVRAVGSYLSEHLPEDPSVSQAQVEAYQRVVNAIPEGKLRDLANRLSPVQKVSARINERVLQIHDAGIHLIKPILLFKSPLTAAIPEKPFSKVGVHAANFGAGIAEKVVISVSSFYERVKARFKKSS